MNSLFQLDIPKRNTACSKGGERLVPGMHYFSLILTNEDQKTTRQDYCLSCWEDVSKNLTSNHAYWQSNIDAKTDVKGIQSKVLKALALLKELLSQVEHNEAEIFVLSLFLARARQLVLRQEIKQGEEKFYLFEVARQDEFITVKKLNLDSLEIKSLQQCISAKLVV